MNLQAGADQAFFQGGHQVSAADAGALTPFTAAAVAYPQPIRYWPHSRTDCVAVCVFLLQKHGYIGEFELVDDHRSGKIVVELNGRLNKCGVISPRYDIGFGEIEDWIGRLLPSRQFGLIILTTSSGMMDHEEARRKKVGGKVLGFFY